MDEIIFFIFTDAKCINICTNILLLILKLLYVSPTNMFVFITIVTVVTKLNLLIFCANKFNITILLSFIIVYLCIFYYYFLFTDYKL